MDALIACDVVLFAMLIALGVGLKKSNDRRVFATIFFLPGGLALSMFLMTTALIIYRATMETNQ